MKTLELPNTYAQRLETLLQRLGYSTEQPKRLSQAVLQLSDFYIANPTAPSPLGEKWAQAAYLSYFFPLNYARNAAVVREGQRFKFFEGFDKIYDFGSGLGSASLAVQDAMPALKEMVIVDTSEDALELQRHLRAQVGFETSYGRRFPPITRPETSLGILSYAYTELGEFPLELLKCEGLMILEPSTRDDGRRLLELRQRLLSEGYSAWAPCPHQGDCPLLVDSERDWCHDRIGWQGPAWWSKLEAGLPMKNRTLTMSYVLLRRTPAPQTKLEPGTRARLVGDTLVEKGKTRQLLCLDSKRRFLTWFPQRIKEDLEFDRGDWLTFTTTLEEKSDEIRLKAPHDVRIISPPEI